MGHMDLRGYSILAIEERATETLLGRSGPWFPEGWPMLEVGWLVDLRRQQGGTSPPKPAGPSLDWCFANLDVDEVCSLIRPENRRLGPRGRKAGRPASRSGSKTFLGDPADLWVHQRPPVA